MADKSIFQHISFFTLSEKQKKIVRNYAKSRQLTEIGIKDVFQNQKELSVSLDYWDTKLDILEQFTSIHSMSKEDKEMLRDELCFALYISYARYKLDLVEGLGDVLDSHGQKISQCNDLINTVEAALTPGTPPYKFNPLPTVADDQVSWGLGWIRVLNERRLYWVWAGRGGVLGATIDLLPDNNFYYKAQALGALDLLVPFSGTLSWSLYYFRCSVILGIAFQHTTHGPWMSQEDQTAISWKEHFAVQLDKSKFYLMNDFFWANCNLACYFWLCGNAVADYYGGALTAVLLLMDVSLSIWAYVEEYALYEQQMKGLIDDISKLTQGHQRALKNAQECKLNLDYKLYALYVDMLYAISLFVAFSFLYSFFLPTGAVTASTALTLAVTGTVLCFTLNSLAAALKQGLEVCKSIEQLNYADNDAEKLYHQKNIEYKQACLLRGVMIDFLIPPVVFGALVFLPLNMGLSVIAVGLALAVKFHYYIDSFEPVIKSMPKLNSDPVKVITPNISQGFFGTAASYLHEQREMVLKCE